VVVNGLVLAEDGLKMSKRLKNYPDPVHMLDTYGADALRLYLIYSPVVRAENLCFSEEGVKHALRHLLIPWWNAYSFFVTYARVDHWKPETGDLKPESRKSSNLLDRWIHSSLERLNQEVVAAMDGYDLQRAIRPFVRFVEDLTNWYIRRSRRRFWKSSNDEDKAQAYATLYEVLLRLSQIAAPFVPFISEAIYRNLRTPDMPESVHLCNFPVSEGRGRDPDLESQMDDVVAVVGMGRQLRADHNLKVRQPLRGLHVVCRDGKRLAQIEALRDVVSEELNVREVWFSARETELASFSAKANFARLGPRLGLGVKKAAARIQQLGPDILGELVGGKTVSVDVDGQRLELSPDDVVVERKPREGLAVASAGNLVVAIETDLTQELIREGLAREFVSRIQGLRKDADLEVTDRIRVRYSGPDDVREAVDEHKAYIENETLCIECTRVGEGLESSPETDLNGHACRIALEKAK
jgi:isoleucyl-tRNA synthetase